MDNKELANAVISARRLDMGDYFSVHLHDWERIETLATEAIHSLQSQEADHEAIAQAHMAGQAEAGIDPSYSNAQRYAECVSPASVQQEAEPVAEVIPSLVGIELAWCNPPGRNRPPVGTKLYTQPPKAKMDDEPILCETCQGNGEIVTDLDRYLNAHEGDVGDEAVAECPDCYDGYRAAPAKAQIPEGWQVHAKVNAPADIPGQRIVGYRVTIPEGGWSGALDWLPSLATTEGAQRIVQPTGIER